MFDGEDSIIGVVVGIDCESTGVDKVLKELGVAVDSPNAEEKKRITSHTVGFQYHLCQL